MSYVGLTCYWYTDLLDILVEELYIHSPSQSIVIINKVYVSLITLAYLKSKINVVDEATLDYFNLMRKDICTLLIGFYWHLYWHNIFSPTYYIFYVIYYFYCYSYTEKLCALSFIRKNLLRQLSTLYVRISCSHLILLK